MARRSKYGNTWWGNAWVEAMERIDLNTNRLPRGRRYANSGKVTGIQIDDGQVAAWVQGSRSKPYKVAIKLTELTPKEIKVVEQLVTKDPALAAELSMGRLPETILGHLEEKNIALLPTGWDDIRANCSCPDWANSCKHLAAVYYIIANEIDKDPMILFKLRQLDDKRLMQVAGFGSTRTSEQLVVANNFGGLPNFIPYQQVKIVTNADYQTTDAKQSDELNEQTNAVSVDLSALAASKESLSIFALLKDNPLFYPNDNFKGILLKAYKNIARSMEQLELKESNFSFKDTLMTLIYPPAKQWKNFLLNKQGEPYAAQFHFFSVPVSVSYGNDRFPSRYLLSLGGQEETTYFLLPVEESLVNKRKKGIRLPLDSVLELFLSLPFDLASNRAASADFLRAVVAVARALATSSSFIPALRGFEQESESFYIVYKPLDRSDKLQEIVDYLAAIMPLGFVFCRKDKTVLEGTEAVEELLTVVLTYLVNRFCGIKMHPNDKTAAAFFAGQPYASEKFEEEQTAKAISDWLGWLNLRPADIAPVIDIGLPKPGKEKFTLRMKVEDKSDSLAPVLRLKEVFYTDKEELFSQPVEYVRREVARQMTIAGEHVPVLKKLLKNKGKMRANLDSLKLADFLTQGQTICSLLGIKVIIPKELQKMTVPQLALAAKTDSASDKGVSYLNLDEMLDFSWQVSIGGESINQEEFSRLVESASGVVQFKDQYLLLEPGEVSGILKKLRQSPPQLSSMEVLQAAVVGETAGAVFNPGQVLEQWVRDLGTTKETSLPLALTATLRPYQERGYYWLYNNTIKGLGSCLADDMGLGKTIQVITLIAKLKEEDWSEKPVLVICPTALISNWLKECSKFAPSLQVEVYHGAGRRLTAKNADVIITSYGILRRDAAKFKRHQWGLVVIDEAQNIKNPDSSQTKAVKSIPAKSYIALSGTPVENRMVELWSIFDFINEGYLGRRRDFAQRFARPIEKYRDMDKITKLKTVMAPFLLRRLKSDKTIIKDLPPKVVKEEHCYLSKQQAALYQQVVDSMLSEIKESQGIARKGMVFKLMTALKQICNHPVQYTKKGQMDKDHSGKAARTVALLEQILAAGDKALIFTQYKQMGQLLQQLIREELQLEPLFFHGGLSRQGRDRLVDSFQQEADCPIMIVSLKAGGTGLNLTAATNVIHYDLWWNPAVEDQATDRTYRIGQTKTVMVHRLISQGTFEEKINDMMSRKRELAQLTVSQGEHSLSELSNAELKDLFNLDPTS